jgi:hypothetical protein
VFTVADSPWLAERHDYEMQRYSTPLLETYLHYVFQFHDEFVEAIAEGIWLDATDPCRPSTGLRSIHWTCFLAALQVTGTGPHQASNGKCAALPAPTAS